jgi:serine/threonine protein kinase
MITLGERVGDYTLVRELGRGGMGAVYLAIDHKLNAECAIKVLHAHLVGGRDDDLVIARFKSEVKIAQAIAHAAIVHPREIDRLPDGSWYYVMEYIDGPTLTKFCKDRGKPLPLSLALEIVAPICEAFELVHALKFVHRDLKPDNVLVVQKGGRASPRVLDFGIAKRIDEQGLTVPGAAMPGTAAFMAPEQARGEPATLAADVYSLGVMVYWMVTGRLPFEATDNAMYFHQVSDTPVDPRTHAPELPPLAATVLLTALHKDPDRRPKSMGQLALMLARAVPAGDMGRDGIAIIREVASRLLVVGNLDETLRSPGVVTRRESAGPWKYEYGPPLGKGGMAQVFKATLRGGGQFAVPRAIKVILDEFSSQPEFRRMFEQEARVAALLRHPNIVAVLDHDTDPQGRLYIAMEYIDGIDLGRLMEAGPIPHGVAIHLLTEVLEALGYVHDLPPTGPLASPAEQAARGDARGLIHRDVSPCNVMLSWLGEVKLADFGLAKARSATNVTGSAFAKGKAGYMSPEQASAKDQLDGRTDLWPIGVMLWEMLTGRRLFDQPDFASRLLAVVHGDIRSPDVLTEGCPADLTAITMRLLERQPSNRYRTAQEVIDALQSCQAVSKNGRAELLKLLADRFPDRARRVATPSTTASESVDPEPETASGMSAPVEPDHSPLLIAAPNAAWATTTGHGAGEAIARPRPSTPRRRQLVIGTAIAVAAAAFTVLGLVAKRHDRATTGAATIATRDTTPAAASPTGREAPQPPFAPAARQPKAPNAAEAKAVDQAPAAEPPALSLVVQATPAAAMIEIEGARRLVTGAASVTARFSPGAKVEIRAHLDGYLDARRLIEVDRDTTLTLALTPIAPPAAPSPVVRPAGPPSGGNRPPTRAPSTPATKPTKRQPPRDGELDIMD